MRIRRCGSSLPAVNPLTALRQERASFLGFCNDLAPDEWATESRAAGWRIQDVVAHLGSGCHAMFGPSVLTMVTSSDIEGTNDIFVARRRHWEPARVLAEYRVWSRRMITAAKIVCWTPARKVAVPLAELGRFPLDLLLFGAMTFDQHVHLRHDMAPALDRSVPESDANRVAVVLRWMFAVLQNQLSRSRPDWLDRPIGIVLDGPGGGSWIVDVNHATSWENADIAEVHTWISSTSLAFPVWATSRARWSDCDVNIKGDQNYGAAFLDSVNVV